jgi:hypothetical protein
MACSGPLAAAHDNDELQARIRARIDQEVTRARNDQQIQDMIMEPFPGEER